MEIIIKGMRATNSMEKINNNFNGKYGEHDVNEILRFERYVESKKGADTIVYHPKNRNAVQYLVFKAINWSYDTITYNEETNTLKCEDNYVEFGGDKAIGNLAMGIIKNGGSVTFVG